METLHVWTSPGEIRPDRVPGSSVVVIDVLLATTSMLTILDHGARRVYPAPDLQEARRLTDSLSSERLIAGGELNMSLIEGFDRGPLPCEYTPERVERADVVFLTTNGTRTLGRVRDAEDLILGCLRNAQAVADELLDRSAPDVYLVCAGSRGQFALEDFLGAGALVHHLSETELDLNDAAVAARQAFRRHRDDPLEPLRRSRVGGVIEQEGHLDCLEHAGALNASARVPRVNAGDQLVAHR